MAEPGIPEPGNDYSTGGFIGPTALADGVIVGGTAVGGAPYLHAIDAASGDVLWQQDVAGPTYAAAAEANGVVFIGGTDFTFRALDLRSGDVLWERELSGAVSGPRQSGGAVVPGARSSSSQATSCQAPCFQPMWWNVPTSRKPKARCSPMLASLGTATPASASRKPRSRSSSSSSA